MELCTNLIQILIMEERSGLVLLLYKSSRKLKTSYNALVEDVQLLRCSIRRLTLALLMLLNCLIKNM